MDKNSKMTVIAVVIVCGMLSVSSLALAVDIPDRPGFFPAVSIGATYDDNILRQENNEESDNIFTISPELAWNFFVGKNRFSLKYLGEYAEYDTNDNENYDDHTLSAAMLLDVTKKFNVDLQADYYKLHEARGSSGIVLGTANAKPNEYREARLFGQFTYGRRIAKAQFQLDIEGRNLNYTNNNQDFRDRDTNTVTGRFYYKLAPKTAAIIELSHRNIDYDRSRGRDLDSTERFYRIGLRWDATYQTSGEFKIGRFEKNFDSSVENDGSGTSIEASVDWQPRTYSKVTFTAARRPNESATVDSFYTSSFISADWQHDLSSRTTFDANVRDGTDDYTGLREDDLFSLELGVNYKLRRWLDIGLRYNYSERNSNQTNADYEDNRLMLSATLKRF